MLLELFMRSGALLLFGAFLLRFCQSASAAMRHRLLLSLFILLALLPLLSVLLPEIPLTYWLTSHESQALVTVQEGPTRTAALASHSALNWLFLLWLTGFLTATLPLLVGQVGNLRRVGNPPLHFSDKISTPLTCGVFRPIIILPTTSRNWPDSRLQAVLAHELAHIRRHDLAAQIAVHLICALWWFQPLVWPLRSKLRKESELACDAEVLRSGFRPSQYAHELLSIAASISGNWALSAATLSMVRKSDLEQRIEAILSPPATTPKTRTIYVLAIFLGAASVAASAITVNQQPGGSLMKRTILSALLTSAGLSAATVGGYIHDASGAALPDAKVSIYNPDHSAKQETLTGPDGKFGLNLAEGKYILRVEKPGFASIFRTFDLQPDSKLDRDFTMSTEGTPTLADSSLLPPEPQPKHIRVGGQVAQSNLITKITPTYPVAAKQAQVQGQVNLDVTISKEGIPLDLRVVSSPSDDLSESALEAVRQWRYRPTLLNGNPVEIETTIVVNYTLLQ